MASGRGPHGVDLSAAASHHHRVVLHVPRRRPWCDSCGGPRLDKLSWLGRYQRVTDRLAQACGQLLHSSDIKAVAAFFDLGWHTVKSIDKALLLATTAQPQCRQVLWRGQGRSRETARQFFE